MTPADRFEAMIAAWLGAAGRDRAPREALDGVFDRTRSMRPLPAWQARVVVPHMRRGSTVLVGSPMTRRLAIAATLVVMGLAAALAVAGAVLLRTELSRTQLFVYVANPISLASDFCADGRDCRNALAGWPGGRFLLSQRVGSSEPEVLVEAPWPSTIIDHRLSPTGTHLAYVRTQTGFPASCLQLATVELTSGEEQLVAEITGGWDWALDPAVEGRARLVFAAAGRCSPGGDGIFAYDPEARSVTRLLDIAKVWGDAAYRRFGFSLLAVHPDGRRAVLSAFRPQDRTTDTSIVSIDGVDPPQPVRCNCSGVGAAWSSDGASLAVETGAGSLLLGRGDGSSLRTIADLAEWPAWSPDGATLAYYGPVHEAGAARDDRGVFVVDGWGGEAVQIATARYSYPTLGTPPRWSPDGDWIYWSDVDGTWAVWKSGADLRRLALPARIDLRWISVAEP